MRANGPIRRVLSVTAERMNPAVPKGLGLKPLVSITGTKPQTISEVRDVTLEMAAAPPKHPNAVPKHLKNDGNGERY